MTDPMTQAEKTEAVIDALPEHREVNSDVIEIALDLARKLDAVAKAMKMPAGSWEEVGKRDKAIRAILARP